MNANCGSLFVLVYGGVGGYSISMQIVIVALLAATAVLAVLILLKISKPQDNRDVEKGLEDVSRQLAAVSGRLDEMSRNNTAVSQSVEKGLGEIRADNEKRLDGMRHVLEEKMLQVDARLREIRTDNEKRLEEIRQTVDEKLQKTLESRLSVTFKTVSDQLESVYKQLGEMQNLAKGVDNLEKVLTNVKTRGMWGELQAERILSEILTPDQYVKNVVTKKGGRDPVEFAVKLPGAEEGSFVLMPIDSKFPREDYERLCEATEKADTAGVLRYRDALEKRIKLEAKGISEKYIDVPNTTDFAVLFLPIEGLYAEILSVPGLQESLQRQYRVMVAGPTTLASLLNSLQMGFRTLAIEKRSAEVWNILGQVKTQFGKFETILDKVQSKLRSASNDVEKVFVRQRAMSRALKGVEAAEESNLIEYDNIQETEEEEEENDV